VNNSQLVIHPVTGPVYLINAVTMSWWHEYRR